MTTGRSKVSAGVRTDCESLIEAFRGMNSLRYEDFAKVWTAKKMSFIFCGREDNRELFEFFEESLTITKNLWLSRRSDDQLKMGGFYLTYAFYMKQPLKLPVKIRLTLNEWESCMMFVSYVIQNEHTDALYIFRYLLREHAFHFVHLPLEIHPKVEGLQQEEASTDEHLKFEDRLLEYTKDRSFQQFQACHERYHALKKVITSQHFMDQPASLTISDDNLMLDIKKITDEYSKNLKGGLVYDSVTGTASAQEQDLTNEDIGSRRVNLKKQQFVQQTKSTNELPYRQRLIEYKESQSEPSIPTSKVKKDYTWHNALVESNDSSDSNDEPIL